MATEATETMPEARRVLHHGMAPIKPEYIDTDHKPRIAEEFLPSEVTKELQEGSRNRENTGDEPPQKRPKLKGRNKKRPIEKNPDEKDRICPNILRERECPFTGRCRYSHDIDAYIAAKPPDISDKCYIFENFGKCPYGFACRFASSHLTTDHKNVINADLYDQKKDEKRVMNILAKDTQKLLWKKKYNFGKADKAWKAAKKNQSERDEQHQKKGGHKLEKSIEPEIGLEGSETPSNNINNEVDPAKNQDSVKTEQVIAAEVEHSSDITKSENGTSTNVSHPEKMDDSNVNPSNSTAFELQNQEGSDITESGDNVQNPGGVKCDSVRDSSDAGMDTCKNSAGIITKMARDNQKKTIDFRDKLYLAPLTTVGNLPFRRVCKQLGADITCGEMAVCTNLLQGQLSEWALLKRHVSEDIFGIQVCGSFPDTMTRCAQIVCDTLDVDFIDINCGCPIDLIFKRGEGSALMGRTSRFETIVRSMTSVMDVPLTVKMRTGIYGDKNTAHTLLPRLRDWGVAMTTIHGRSREQRYTRLADWEYINDCAEAAKPMPLFGNGDILSFEDYVEHREKTGVAGVMLARGALIKPWLFTEIKENRHWDISANERLDMLRDFSNYGLEHWGSDQQGVSITRRFLLEWMSFLYRYIPVGLMERLPQRINEKPPHYFGRSDLETMLSSPNCGDWIKITEMLLGPVPSGFTFLPKHKANAYK